ncbi:MAG: TonB-dependent receptor domain-containing protein [Flavobacterium sp.]
MQQVIYKFLIFFTFYSFGQNGEITGTILDQKTNESIPYSTIVVEDGGKIETGGVSNDKGKFVIEKLPLKKLKVLFQFIGYISVEKEVTLSNERKRFDFGNIYLVEDVTQLKEVEVVGEQSTTVQKIDRKVINVGKDLISVGATAGQLMNNIPSVSVDPQTNQISLRGNENVRILIDGKPSNISAAQLLQQIPSASIKQVELITNPSAKYNPEGMSGIINIILHKNATMGFNGSINNGVTFGITPKTNSSLDMNYKVNKFNFYTNYGLNHGKYFNHGFIDGYNPTRENRTDFVFNNLNNSNLIKFGIDYYINEKNTISVYTNQNFSSSNGSGTTTVDYRGNLYADTKQIYDNDNDNYNQIYNIAYKKLFKKEGRTLEFEINHNKSKNTEDGLFTFPIVNGFLKNDITRYDENTFINLDFVNPMGKKSKLELGAEARIENTNNVFDVNKSYYSQFNYDRNIYSGYFTFSTQVSQFSFQVGTRFEKFVVDAQFNQKNEKSMGFRDEFFTMYPSAFITYSINDKNNINLSYSRRVDRPSIGQVNPIREWSTPTVESVGNPNLTPQFTNSIELSYSKTTKIGTITSNIFYRKINDEITRLVYQNPNNLEQNIMTYDNFDGNDAYGVELSGNLNFTKWWSANFGLDFYSRKVNGLVEFEKVTVQAEVFNARINHNFTASKNMKVQLFGMYRGEEYGLQFKRLPMWRTDIGGSYTILKGQGTISARLSDIFNSMEFGFDGDRPFVQNGGFFWESRTLYIGFNYRFGGGKNKAMQRKQRDKNEKQGSGGFM